MVLITGVSGLIGKHLAFRLADSDRYRLRGQYLTSAPDPKLILKGVSLVKADIEAPASLKGIAEGCDILVHSAAKVIDFGTEAEFRKAHVEASQNVLNEAIASGVKRFVYISSFGVAGGLSRSSSLPDEQTKVYKKGIPYDDVKIEAEELVSRVCKSAGMEYVIIRPSAVIGPGSVWVTEPLKRFKNLMLIGGGLQDACLIDARNLAMGIQSAMESSKAAGEIYYMMDDWGVSWKQYINDLCLHFKGREIRKAVPYALAYPAAALLEKLFLLWGGAPPISRKAVMAMGSDRRVSTIKAQQELAYRSYYSYQDCMQSIFDHHSKLNSK
jgi:nucleoside-diphosphate-sugar epimerase